MSTPDLAPIPALPDRARPFRWGYFSLRLLYVVVLLAVAATLPSTRSTPERFRYHVGDISRERVVAPYDFKVEKDEATLRREQEQAAAAVVPVFTVDSRVSAEMLERFATFQQRAQAVVLDTSLPPAARAERLRVLGVPLSQESAEALTATGRANRAFRELSRWLHEIYDAGIVSEKRNDQVRGYGIITLRDGENESTRSAELVYDRREALALIENRAQTSLPADPRGVRLIGEMAAPFVQPNVVYDRAETEWRRVQAQAAVQATVGVVQEDELIVDANQRVTPEIHAKLQSLRNEDAARRGRSKILYPPVARMLLMLLFIAVFVTYLRRELPAVYRNNSMLAMFTLLTVTVMALAELIVGILGLSEFLIPFAVAPLVVASVLDKRPALTFTLMLTVVATSVSELRAPFVPVAVLGGVTAVYSVSRLRHRWEFMRAFLTIAIANLAAILAWDLAPVAPLNTVLHDAMWGTLNAFLAIALAFLVLPVVEHLFGLTSDITLLELSDLNRPLLKKLQLEAPGTYHHSMVVGSLAEAAAEAIGANSLLARVSAYYHDIGKLAMPEYFAENEPIASRSRHDKLAPSMSALIVKRHIALGMEMAKRERLPQAVRDAIPEHHGTMVMAYFYVKAQEQDPTVRREDFCYPGPKPRSKETAILMLADGVQSASRSLEEPTPSRIRNLLARIIDERMHQGQLDQCGLTMQDLARIRGAFFPVLMATFHVRTPYPEELKRRQRSDADIRRETS